MAKPKKGAPRELPEEGVHNAICKIVADLGTQQPKNKDWDAQRKIMVGFELVDLSTKDKPSYISNRYTFTASSKNLRKLLKTWLGVKNPEDFDMAECLGKPALVTIEHSDTGEYANISAVTQLQKGTKIGKGVMSPVGVFLEPGEYDAEAFESLPEWIQNIIIESPEFDEVSAPPTKPAKKKAK